MTYAQLDHIADAINPLLAISVVVGAIWLERGRAWNFLLRGAIAYLLVQQSAKLVQKIGPLGHHFPSTHFAVALCFATLLALLNRRWIVAAIAVAVCYGALMLYQHYHTPLELVGALYAIPVAYLCWNFKRRALQTSDKTDTIINKS